MLTEMLWLKLDVINMEEMFFQQDGVTCNTARETRVLLRTKFPGYANSRFGIQHWPRK